MSAEAAARAWGARVLRPINVRENEVYEVVLADGARGALRLHRPGYQSAAGIRSELWWMARLAEAGVPVPHPVPRPDGELLAEAGGRMASVVSWIEGREMGNAAMPLDPDRAETETLYRRLGGLLADLHNATDALELPGDFERPAWDRAAFTGDAPLWGRYWENPALGLDEARLMAAARARAAEALAAAEDADQGLIHADVLRENVLVHGTEMALIDFDDCGFGFRAYDLATALVQGLEDPMNPVAGRALVEGYQARRRADAPPLGDVGLFVALRAFASAGWIMTRAAPDDPRMRFYAARAVAAARRLVV